MLIILPLLIEQFELVLNMSFKNHFFLHWLVAIVLMNSVMFADVSKEKIEAQIIDKIVVSLFPGQKITVWGETVDQKNMIKQSTKISRVESSSNADLIIVTKNIPQNLSDNCVIITTEYALLKKDERIIGAFFWQKGRPNLLFLRPRMQKANVNLGHEFDKYIEDEL